MASPLRFEPHADVMTWLGLYKALMNASIGLNSRPMSM